MINKLIWGMIFILLGAWWFREKTNRSSGSTPVTIKQTVNKFDQANLARSTREVLTSRTVLHPGNHTLVAGRTYEVAIPSGKQYLDWRKPVEARLEVYDPVGDRWLVQEEKPLGLEWHPDRRWLGFRVSKDTTVSFEYRH